MLGCDDQNSISLPNIRQIASLKHRELGFLGGFLATFFITDFGGVTALRWRVHIFNPRTIVTFKTKLRRISYMQPFCMYDSSTTPNLYGHATFHQVLAAEAWQEPQAFARSWNG